MLQKVWTGDVRIFQVLLLGSLLSWGAFTHDFSLSMMQIFLAFSMGLMTQLFFCYQFQLPYKSLLSAAISCLGVVLLLRSNGYWLHPLCSIVAISSKYFVQWKGRHLFNPSALAIVLVLLFFENTWISPGQWGSQSLQGVWFFVLGSIAVGRSRIWEISLWFLFFYLGGLALRNLWLGYEWTILMKASQNGALLLFAFFMISDPRTSPNHYWGRVLQAFLVAAGALCFHFYFYKTNGFIYCLILSSLFVPLINHMLQAPTYQWRSYAQLKPV